MENTYQPIATSFRQEIESAAAQKKAISINYITELKELLSATSIIKTIFAKDDAEYIELNNGTEIRLDKIVRVGTTVSPGYSGYDFSNSCSL